MIKRQTKGAINMNDDTELEVEDLEVLDEVEAEEAEETEEPELITAKAIAARCGLDPKKFRAWLRSTTKSRANKGGRWGFTAEQADRIEAACKAAHAPKKVTVIDTTAVDEDDDVLDDLEDELEEV